MNAMLRMILQSPLFERLGWTLVHSVWQCAAIAAALAIVLVMMRCRASARYLAGCVALILSAALPILTFFVVAPARTAQPVAIVLPTRMTTVVRPEWAAAPAMRVSSQPLRAVLPWAVLAWLFGVLVFSILHVGGWISVQRLRRNSTLIESETCKECLMRLCERLGVSRAVALAESALVEVPSVVGCWRPMILLPCSALTGLSAEYLEALLAHELAHIRRHDYLINILQTAVETLLFYHPAVWWISRVIRHERENCCDDLAVNAIGNARVYGAALAAMEQFRAAPVTPALAINGGSLLRRIKRLLTPEPRRTAFLWPTLLALAIIVGLGAGSRFMLPSARAQEQAHPTTMPTTSSVIISQPVESSDARLRFLYADRLLARIAELEVDLTETKTKFAPDSPIVNQKENALRALKKNLAEVAPALATKPAQTDVYYIAGVPRSGVYSISQPIALKAAILAAGSIPAGAEAKSFLIIHPDGKDRMIIPATDALNGPAGEYRIKAGDVIMLTDAMPVVDEKAEYYVGGHVPRSGVFSWVKDLNLLQALIAAGLNPADVDGWNVQIVHREKTTPQEIYRVIDLINGNLVNVLVQAGDQIMVRERAFPATGPVNQNSPRSAIDAATVLTLDPGLPVKQPESELPTVLGVTKVSSGTLSTRGLPMYRGIARQGSGTIPTTQTKPISEDAALEERLIILSKSWTDAQLRTIEAQANYMPNNPILIQAKQKEQELYNLYQKASMELMQRRRAQTQP